MAAQAPFFQAIIAPVIKAEGRNGRQPVSSGYGKGKVSFCFQDIFFINSKSGTEGAEVDTCPQFKFWSSDNFIGEPESDNVSVAMQVRGTEKE